MMVKNRQDYLKNHWSAFPVMPSNPLYWGRIQDITPQSITLEFNFTSQTVDLEFPSWIYGLTPNDRLEFIPLELFRTADQVCLDTQGIWTLLTPYTMETELITKVPGLSLAPNHKYFQQWTEFINNVRLFFNSQNFTEIPTPALVTCPGTEPSLEVFKTQWIQGKTKKSRYLRTSPEIQLKKHLCLGFVNIYEMALCFRNDENSNQHLNEFLMLEWYRAFNNLHSIQKDVENLFRFLNEKLKLKIVLNFQHFKVSDLFKTYLEIELQPDTSYDQYLGYCQKLNLIPNNSSAKYSIDDLYYLLFVSQIEPRLPLDSIVFISHYPPFQAALSRLTADGWADRFEVYWKGLELANAFQELNDPKEQHQRSLTDLRKKEFLGKTDIELDNEFFQFLENGLPPSGGIALGLERLFMAFYNISKIQELRPFSIFGVDISASNP